MSGSERSAFSVALGGDAILVRRWSALERSGLERVVEPIRDADAAVVNLETLLHDFEAPPSAASGGTYMRAPPWVADELAWAGFGLFSAATNHTGDYGIGGVEATMHALDERDIAYAGLGENLALARAPAYRDTAAGRVGLVAACSTMTPGSAAGEQRPDVGGRPGLNPLRLETTFGVSAERFEQVKALSAHLGLDAVKGSLRRFNPEAYFANEDDSTFSFFNPGGAHVGTSLTFEVSDDPGVRQTPQTRDRDANLDQIRRAARQSDWVVASLHSHEGENGAVNDSSVPAFVERYARSCIDAGADVFVAHGSHVLGPIEVYDGRPIFYGLGNLVFQSELVERLPADIYHRYGLDHSALPPDVYNARTLDEDGEFVGALGNRAYYESVVPRCRFEDGTLEAIELHPISLQLDSSPPDRGLPVRATGTVADRILERLRGLSAAYDTRIETDGDVGEIRAEA